MCTFPVYVTVCLCICLLLYGGGLLSRLHRWTVLVVRRGCVHAVCRWSLRCDYRPVDVCHLSSGAVQRRSSSGAVCDVRSGTVLTGRHIPLRQLPIRTVCDAHGQCRVCTVCQR